MPPRRRGVPSKLLAEGAGTLPHEGPGTPPTRPDRRRARRPDHLRHSLTREPDCREVQRAERREGTREDPGLGTVMYVLVRLHCGAALACTEHVADAEVAAVE